MSSSTSYVAPNRRGIKTDKSMPVKSQDEEFPPLGASKTTTPQTTGWSRVVSQMAYKHMSEEAEQKRLQDLELQDQADRRHKEYQQNFNILPAHYVTKSKIGTGVGHFEETEDEKFYPSENYDLQSPLQKEDPDPDVNEEEEFYPEPEEDYDEEEEDEQ